jgi:hypothetical protein
MVDHNSPRNTDPRPDAAILLHAWHFVKTSLQRQGSRRQTHLDYKGLLGDKDFTNSDRLTLNLEFC